MGPTCSLAIDVSLCIAIDDSGSVCSDTSCKNCDTIAIGAPNTPQCPATCCNKSGITPPTLLMFCCEDFKKITVFATALVVGIEQAEFGKELKKYSIVEFSQSADVTQPLTEDPAQA